MAAGEINIKELIIQAARYLRSEFEEINVMHPISQGIFKLELALC